MGTDPNSKDFTELAREVNDIVRKQREIAEKQGTDSAEYKRYLEEANQKMEAFEKANADITKQLQDEKSSREALAQQVKDLEANAAIATSRTGGYTREEKEQAANRFVGALIKGQWNEYVSRDEAEAKRILENMKGTINRDAIMETNASKFAAAIEQKAANDLLRTDISEFGGFLCPPEYAAQLERNMIEYGNVRNFARVRRTANKVYKQPVRIGVPRASRPGEAREGNSTVSNYGMVDFTPVRLTNTVPVTSDQLAFNAYDLAAELVKDNAEAFAITEGQEFFNGNGSGVEEGLGFTTDSAVPEYTTGTTTLTFDDMINITGQLKQGYNPMYLFNRRTLAYLRTLKDSNDRYLWSGPFGDAASGAAATINGYPYSAAFIEFDDFDVSGGYPVLFADMAKFYQIVDRTDITVIRDEYTRKKEAIVEFTFNKWCYGAPMIKEAGIRMKRQA